MDKVDVIVVGAGVIGLAVSRALSASGRSVVALERHDRAATETSARNSGVIHSGIYYPPGSEKQKLCVKGRELLYEFCEARHVSHRRCGKLIVAQSSETGRLQALQRNALTAGVTDLQWLDAKQVSGFEPEVRAAAGLWCPSTGIISVDEYALALQGDLEASGGAVAFRSRFVSARRIAGGFMVDVDCEGQSMQLECAGLVNSAGLAAVSLLSSIEGHPASLIPRAHFAKGNYFDYAGRSPFTHLVYPMPGEAGLGVHATLDLGGQLRFGPDVEWLNGEGLDFDYNVDVGRGEAFYAAIREYWPGLPDGSLRAAYSGIRPKLVGAGAGAADFCIQGPAQHGVAGLVNLLGMESPGLTSSLAVAERVVGML